MSKQNYEYHTAEDIVTQLRREVADEASTDVEFMDEDSLIFKINEFKRQIINAPFSGLRFDPRGRIQVEGNGRGWDFMEEDKAFDFVVRTAISAQITAGYIGNVAIADGSNFTDEPSSVILYDQRGNWDYVTYLTKPDANTLGTLGNVDKTWASGTECHKLYKLPTDFARAKKIKIGNDEIFEGPENPETSEEFAVYKGFLWMPRNFGASSGTLTYFVKPTDITDIAETLDVPKELSGPVLLNMLKAWAFGLDGEDQELIDTALFSAADALSGALGYTTSSSNKRIRLARRPPRSPTSNFMGRRTSNFDQGNGYN